MKYISLDVETLGLIPGEHSIIQIGAVCEDTNNPLSFEECPKYDILIKQPIYHGTPFAMSMHPHLLLELEPPFKGPVVTSTRRIEDVEDVAEDFLNWLLLEANYFPKNKPSAITIAGKNAASFDIPHLKTLPNWNAIVKTKQRVIDPAILFWNPLIDKELPNLEDCKKRAGFTSTAVAHTALEDAWDVVLLIRKAFEPSFIVTPYTT